MAPRGLSAEEKRVKLLEIFHESKDFYQLKELEKLGPKLKGIVSQSVKEVLQSLVDDNMVQMDKIGSGNFYWSFPSQATSMVSNQVQDTKAALEKIKAREEEVAALLIEERKSRQPSEERTAALGRLAELRREKDALLREKSAYAESDPQQFEYKKRAGVLAREAAERFTDNVLATLRYLETRGMDSNAAREMFGLGEGWEDLP